MKAAATADLLDRIDRLQESEHFPPDYWLQVTYRTHTAYLVDAGREGDWAHDETVFARPMFQLLPLPLDTDWHGSADSSDDPGGTYCWASNAFGYPYQCSNLSAPGDSGLCHDHLRALPEVAADA